MKTKIIFLAIMLLILAADTASAAQKSNVLGATPEHNLAGYSIKVSDLVFYRDAKEGNSEPFVLNVSVFREPDVTLSPTPLCNLNKQKFNITPITPPNIWAKVESVAAQTDPCSYMLFIIPQPGSWVAGEYVLKVTYQNYSSADTKIQIKNA